MVVLLSLIYCVQFFWVYIQIMGLLDHSESLFLVFKEIFTVLHTGFTNFHSHQQCIQFPFLYILPAFVLYVLDFWPDGGEAISTVVLICVSLMASDVEHVFVYLKAICISIIFFSCSLPISQLDWLVLLLLSFEVAYIFAILVLCWADGLQIFSFYSKGRSLSNRL